jgi:hypothetical protein
MTRHSVRAAQVLNLWRFHLLESARFQESITIECVVGARQCVSESARLIFSDGVRIRSMPTYRPARTVAAISSKSGAS